MIVLDTTYLIDFFIGMKETLGAFEITEIDDLDIALDVLIAGIAVTNGADKIASADKGFDEISKVTGLEILKSSF